MDTTLWVVFCTIMVVCFCGLVYIVYDCVTFIIVDLLGAFKQVFLGDEEDV